MIKRIKISVELYDNMLLASSNTQIEVDTGNSNVLEYMNYNGLIDIEDFIKVKMILDYLHRIINLVPKEG